MSTINHLTIRDLVEEAKKRIVVVVICIVGLSYLMSLTSKSVWINLPAAASLIIILRYLLLDLEMRRKAAVYSSKQSSESTISQKKPPLYPKHVEMPDWRKKVKSPPVEDAIDHFTRHLISEWVTDLWYSKLTPDKEGPEELVNIINGALGEIAGRLRNVNLIDLLTKDLIHLICTHLEQFRTTQMKIEKQKLGSLAIEHRDMELRRLLAAENKLHPALFSTESQHKVLQHLMDGLISFTFKHEDLQCLYFRYTSRELLASAVMRPILNLAGPRFINERIEILVINMKRKKNSKGVNTVQETSSSEPDGSLRISAGNFSGSLDPSVKGVELMQLKNGQSRTAANSPTTSNFNGSRCKDPLLSIDTRSSRSWSSLPLNSQEQTYDDRSIQRHNSGGEWGENLERFSHRKNQALAPENFENMWTKGKNYRKKDGENQRSEQVQQGSSAGKSVAENNGKVIMSKTNEKDTVSKLNSSENGVSPSKVTNRLRVDDTSHTGELNLHYLEDLEEGDSDITPYTSEEEETSNVTGLDSPGTKVWDGRSNRNPGISHIHHPLENFDGYRVKKTGKGHVQHRRRAQSDQKRSRPSSRKKMPVWHEVERSSFLSGDGQDILGSLKGLENASDSSDEYEVESLSRIHSGASASSSAPSSSILDAHSLTVNPLKNLLAVEPFFKMRCEVTGANIVKSGARSFAVYSISAMDINNNSWSVKRRFSHFEELHRCLKEYSEYNLHLPPKHFLSTGLDVPIIQERCRLLDQYLKKLMQLPTISGSIEVWDFLSVDSQTYVFSNSFSIIETLSDNKPTENSKGVSSSLGSKTNTISLRREQLSGGENKDPPSQMKSNFLPDVLTLKTKGAGLRNSENTIKGKDSGKLEESPSSLLGTSLDPTLPTEWVSPNISVPILDLVDVILQLQDSGWIRRQAFWVAKQVLHLGMGDALDDWLIDKIQLLRKGSVIASIIRRVEQILWPDGIFISKHPKHKRPSASSPHSKGPTEISSPRLVDDEQKQEADRRAKFVYELMIDNAPAAIVGLVGRKEYEQCAKDLYSFIQSSVCLKQMTFELIELVLSSAFPELEHVIKQLHEEKHKFGEFKEDY